MFTDHTPFQLLTKAQDIGKGGAAKAFNEEVNPNTVLNVVTCSTS